MNKFEYFDTTGLNSRRWYVFALLPVLVGCLLCLATNARAAVTGSIPFVTAEFSVFNGLPPQTALRYMDFTPPDSTLASISADAATYFPQGLNTNFPDYVSGALFFVYNQRVWDSPTLSGSPYIVVCDVGGTAVGTADIGLTAISEGMVLMSGNLTNELSSRILPAMQDPDIPGYTYRDVSLTMNIQGGQFDGKSVTLHGVEAYGSGPSPNNDDTTEAWSGDIFVALDWGTDPLGNREYMLFILKLGVAIATSNSTCLPLSQVAEHFFGTETSEARFTPDWNALLTEFDANSPQLHLQGAIPELLFLYDFSGHDSVAPSATLPPGMLDVNTVVPLPPVPYMEYTNVYKIINQYDAGVAFNLPKRFQLPNPVPPPTGYTPGGNACGPTSLGMMLYAYGVSPVDARSVFDNTTVSGLTVPVNSNNGFYWGRAYTWLAGKPRSASQKAFSTPSPLPNRRAAHEREVAGNVLNSSGLTRVWRQIDTLLSSKQPVEIRTDLGLHTWAGGGHCILLLGQGHNDALKQIYSGISGDYYIVADPAGHYFGNAFGSHYDMVEDLIFQDVGINYGGWFAVYPKELFQKRISDTSKTARAKYRVDALTIGSYFHVATARITVHSPVNLLVTDPIGRQTGVLPDGTELNQIPYSLYEIAIADEEQDGGDTLDPDGPKTVEIDDPMDGVYTIGLTGTSNGTYTVDWTVTDTNELDAIAQTNAGDVVTGQQVNYSTVIALGGQPSLQLLGTSNSVVLFWPTNTAGYVLQSSSDLRNPDGWSSLAGPFSQSNGVFSFSSNFAAPAMFFRLKK